MQQDVEKYPSKAEDAKKIPKSRLAQYFITNTLNRMNGYVQLSDYQMAALLLRLPSQITSDVFAYSDPYAEISYRKELEQEGEEHHDDEQEFITQNNFLHRI